MARELPPGTERTATGYRSWVWAAGRNHSKRWKAEPTITDVKAWREDVRVAARQPQPIAEQPVVLTGFAADATLYLEAVRAMPSYRDRVRHMLDWIALFGDIPKDEITAAAIRTQRDRWLTIGPKRVRTKTGWVERRVPLSASSVNHRLRALENFFTVMDPGGRNPVRDVPECDEPLREPRGYHFALALEVLSFMPDVTTPKKGETHEPGSLSRVRFETMVWTGLPAVQLARLKPELVDWIAGTVLVPRRQKGKHSRRAPRRQERPRPLLPQAQAALKRFFALGANRAFSSASLGKSVKRAIRAANVVRAKKHLPLIPETATVYDLTRHTFGTEVMRASQNLKVVQELMGHADINQSARYAMAAVSEQNVAALKRLATRTRRRRGGEVGGEVSPRKAGRPGSSGKRQKAKKA